MTTYKIIGEDQGIVITKPFSKEMYDHNDKVREMQNEAVITAMTKIKEAEDFDLMSKMGKSCSGYGYGDGYDLQDIFEDAIQNVETCANNWMREDIWPDFLKEGLVQPLDIDYVGYKK
jgi:hypothetical protein